MKKILFIIYHSIFDLRFFFIYKKIQKNNNKPYLKLKRQQEIKLYKLINYVYEYVPYYKELFDKNNINPKKITKIKDLEKIPILNKEIIRNNIEKFKPRKKIFKYINYFENPTGGTTGTPLKYKISRKDRILSGCLLYRGWSNGGYKLGDKMVFLSGSTLGISSKSKISIIFQQYFRNIKKFSSFDMDKKTMLEFVYKINKFKPKFIRGYPTAIYSFSEFIEKENIKIYSPKSIFTTAEKLFPYMKKKIEKVFNCDVFDNYGLNDGGVSAYECKLKNGLHIDTERAILEVVNKNNKQIKEGTGKIIATDLYNYAFPFIRYETGDLTKITHKKCDCGLRTPRLIKIIGRSTDILITPEGKKIHGWLFLYIFWKYQKGIEKYQVIQSKIDKIDIKIIKNKDFDINQLQIIKSIIIKRSKKWKINFIFVKKINSTKSGKYKFIINQLIQRK